MKHAKCYSTFWVPFYTFNPLRAFFYEQGSDKLLLCDSCTCIFNENLPIKCLCGDEPENLCCGKPATRPQNLNSQQNKRFSQNF